MIVIGLRSALITKKKQFQLSVNLLYFHLQYQLVSRNVPEEWNIEPINWNIWNTTFDEKHKAEHDMVGSTRKIE